ncbi:MAG TPA: aminodeoxychorismate synthase component I [Saprospiraceae bacterium]|nr:aminodeoxychorismate synthase component I [Saprospiraceae bacterium]
MSSSIADPNMQLADWIDNMNTWGKNRIPFLFILDFELEKPVVFPLADIEESGLKFNIGNNLSENSKPVSDQTNFLEKSPVSFETYEFGFQQVMQAIQDGDTYLLNLCYSTKVASQRSLEEIFEKANAPYKLFWPGKFVCFSPEQFVSIKDGMIRTFPMKGTIDASIPRAEQMLLDDLKEQEEHATVVDLLRNDLSIVARAVTVNRYRFISKIHTRGKTLLQTSSEISGQLEGDYLEHLGDIMRALLPAGSVSGAPKKRTVEIIHDTELEKRGYYTGVFGVFDGQNLDSAVMIRMIEQREDGFYYRSGGGITYRSEARSEYQEMIDKVYIPGP